MKIICVGKNYTDHIKEFDGVIPKEMVLFMKPDTALHNLEIPYYIPDFTHNLHHEIEVVLKINQNGKCIAEKYAHKYYDEIALGIDFTARDLQQTLREESLSWEKAKAFDGSAIVGTFVPKTELPELNHLSFRLENNGKTVQAGNTENMLWHFSQIIAEASRYFTLRKGDLFFTGTPKGVAQVQAGDTLEAFLEEKSNFKIKIR